jgi:hypothetical protein
MLRRALMLVGRSMNSKDLGKAFLLDMIALELLITRPHERTSDVMPLRLEALLGWISFWKAEGYDTRIQDLCAKRNNLVHEGDVSRITLSDLKLADDLLQNLFVNVARNIRLFKSREDIIRLAERVQAERLLGGRMLRNYGEAHRSDCADGGRKKAAGAAEGIASSSVFGN